MLKGTGYLQENVILPVAGYMTDIRIWYFSVSGATEVTHVFFGKYPTVKTPGTDAVFIQSSDEVKYVQNLERGIYFVFDPNMDIAGEAKTIITKHGGNKRIGGKRGDMINFIIEDEGDDNVHWI